MLAGKTQAATAEDVDGEEVGVEVMGSGIPTPRSSSCNVGGVSLKLSHQYLEHLLMATHCHGATINNLLVLAPWSYAIPTIF